MNARKDNLVPFELPAEYDPDLSSAVVSAHQEIAKAGLDPGHKPAVQVRGLEIRALRERARPGVRPLQGAPFAPSPGYQPGYV